MTIWRNLSERLSTFAHKVGPGEQGLTGSQMGGNMGGEGGAVIVESFHVPPSPQTEARALALVECLGAWFALHRKN